MGNSLTQRVLYRLERAEIREINPHFQDDYRISWITVLYASRGEREPHVAATYAVLGLHPDKVWPAILERAKSMLGSDYDKFFPMDTASSPKKPVQSVRPGKDYRRAA